MTAKIYAKLSEIQAELKAPKSQYNEYGRYKYRKAEDILEAVKPYLHAQGCTLTCTDDLLLIGDRYYIKATATITCIEDGSEVSTTAFAREEEEKKGMDGSQVTGASSSYARKYALNGLLCIDDTADSDTTNVGDTKDKKDKGKKGPQKPADAPKYSLDSLDPKKYQAWVAGAAEGKNTKTGVPCRQGFIDTFKPTEDQLAAFDVAVMNYRLENNLNAR